MLPLGVVFDTVKPVRHDYRERNRQQEGALRQRNAHRLKITRADVPIIFPVTVPVPCSRRVRQRGSFVLSSHGNPARLAQPGLALLRIAVPDHNQSAVSAYRQYTQKNSADPRKQCRICPNAQRQSDDYSSGECRRLLQNHNPKCYVLLSAPVPALGRMRFLTIVLASSNSMRLPLCFLREIPLRFKIVRAMLKVAPQFFFEFIHHCRTMHKGGPAGPHCIEESHSSPGCAESALAIAATSRFQLSASSCERFRPAIVNS